LLKITFGVDHGLRLSGTLVVTMVIYSEDNRGCDKHLTEIQIHRSILQTIINYDKRTIAKNNLISSARSNFYYTKRWADGRLSRMHCKLGIRTTIYRLKSNWLCSHMLRLL